MKDLKITETITSKEIAEISEKNHSDVLRAIRSMEPAWEKINGSKFALVEYLDAKGEKRPMYNLTKIESLYISTKFNDETRAKLVNRWHQLETNPFMNLSKVEALRLALEAEERVELLEQQVKIQAPKVSYHDKVLSSKSTYVTNQIAKELGTSAVTLNRMLNKRGVQYKQNDTWLLYSKHQGKGFTKTKTYTYTGSDGIQKTSMQTVWTEEGRKFIHEIFNSNLKTA